MSFFRYTLFFLILAISPALDAKGKSKELVIKLTEEESLLGIYLDQIKKDSDLISQDYIQDLHRVVLFDFTHNGKTKLISESDLEEHKKMRSASDWRSLGISYVISAWVRENYLTFSVLSTVEDKICFAEEIKLTADLNRDRRNIHAFASNLHYQLFGEEGIYESKILYSYKTRNVSDPYYSTVTEEIYQCDYDGGNPEQLTHDGSHCVSPHPVLSKDGKNVEGFFYVSYKIGQPKIFWNKFGAKSAQRLCYVPGNQFMPCMSFQGDQVVFINDAPGNPEVFLQEFKPGVGSVGKPRQIFACRRGVQASPVFSPNGKQVAFVSDKEGSPRIYTMDIPPVGASSKEIKPRLITEINRENTKPSWSPDGTKLAYISKVDGVRQVWIYDFITNQEWPLTAGGTNKENPQWARNSFHIIYNTVGNNSCELYMINLSQKESVRLKTEPGIKRFPVWVDKNKG